jgi:hypothetical protein
MNAKNPLSWISVFAIALFAGPGVARAQAEAEADVVAATRGDSDGTYYTKTQLLKLMADANNIKTNSERLSELKVRVYGDAAVATYKDTYDILIMGEHRAHTIIATDTFIKMGDEWKQVASHGTEAK